jgi:hypothetical protein
LFDYGRLRKLAEFARVISIDKTGDGFAVKFSENARIDPDELRRILQENETASFSPSGILRYPTDADGVIVTALSLLKRMVVTGS